MLVAAQLGDGFPVTKRKQPYVRRDVRNERKVSQGVLRLVFGRPMEARVVAAMQRHGFAVPWGELWISPLRQPAHSAAA